MRLTSQPVRVAGDVESVLDLLRCVGSHELAAEADEPVAQRCEDPLGEGSLELLLEHVGRGVEGLDGGDGAGDAASFGQWPRR